MAHMFSLMATLDAATTLCDTDAMLRFVDASPEADGGRIGAVGYCMSGPFVMWAAAERPERLALHRLDPRRQHGDRQAGLAAPHAAEDPLRELLRLRRDRQVGAAGRRREAAGRACSEAGTPHRLEWYPGVEHGFVFPLRPHAYDRAAAERHWERLFSLFERTLRAPA